MSVCVLNCTVPDVKLWRKKNQVVPAYIEPSDHRTVPALLLFCGTQSECGSNVGVMRKNDRMDSS